MPRCPACWLTSCRAGLVALLGLQPLRLLRAHHLARAGAKLALRVAIPASGASAQLATSCFGGTARAGGAHGHQRRDDEDNGAEAQEQHGASRVAAVRLECRHRAPDKVASAPQTAPRDCRNRPRRAAPRHQPLSRRHQRQPPRERLPLAERASRKRTEDAVSIAPVRRRRSASERRAAANAACAFDSGTLGGGARARVVRPSAARLSVVGPPPLHMSSPSSNNASRLLAAQTHELIRTAHESFDATPAHRAGWLPPRHRGAPQTLSCSA